MPRKMSGKSSENTSSTRSDHLGPSRWLIPDTNTVYSERQGEDTAAQHEEHLDSRHAVEAVTDRLEEPQHRTTSVEARGVADHEDVPQHHDETGDPRGRIMHAQSHTSAAAVRLG
jgi:PIN domain nuclease of toxin-antitoxin system